MPAKKKAKKQAETTIELPEVTTLSCGMSFSECKAVTPDEAMEMIARGWVLTQHDEHLTVVARPHEIEP